MNELIAKAETWLAAVVVWIDVTLLSYQSLVQLGIILLLWGISWGIVRLVRFMFPVGLGRYEIYRRLQPQLSPLYDLLLWAVMIGLVKAVADQKEIPTTAFNIAESLIWAWIVIRLATSLIDNREIARLVRAFAWGVAALNIVGWLTPLIEFLDQMTFSLGQGEVSALGILTGVLTLIFLVWLALISTNFLESWLGKVQGVNPSARVLLSKIARIVLIAAAFLFAVSSVGIDLTVFAVFGGAIGVGLGFGLQKVVSNFVSGVILLMDRSIKPGDVVEVSGTYGRINKLAGRYTSVISRDGREHLIPNEDMVTQTVVNWTFSHRMVRRHLQVGISYKSDVDLAMKLMVEAAEEVPRVLDDPAPRVQLRGFGDSSIDLELRMWIRDAKNGVSNVASDVNYLIWKKFNEHGVEFPYPQRDIHIVSDEKKAETLVAPSAEKS
ncbi:mechanosensitive ion channel family protein [Paremcibacter congregatus]|uniref:Mechanosensitive ion channel protein MscS n=1 Tax=Paremcibacter congregatus TaxID=2043170 RepID=A0A2G4YRW0_9PROT|nr:mechanosensitive ion channel domain-containing protein [Paremcibacter congregatus]PHZ85000.1 mechanosensitive ion channel protein MscS [Paremcibacter congregatus]QDE26025.1 mechanosensitive ion channel [Paremcibacter congregatus]